MTDTANRWTDRQTNGWRERQIDTLIQTAIRIRDCWTDRHMMDRLTDGWMESKADTETDRQNGGQTDRLTDS